MHFILLVYKYEYIMNKNSYFVDILTLCGIFQDGHKLLRSRESQVYFVIQQ